MQKKSNQTNISLLQTKVCEQTQHEGNATFADGYAISDVEILHTIITRAEQRDGVDRLPFRAIFSAYEDVLRENNVRTETDQIYFRFLFQLGNRNTKEESLYQKFVALLDRMGIQLEYGDGEGNTNHQDGRTTMTTDDTSSKNVVNDLRMGGNGVRNGRRRRASFNSMHDFDYTVQGDIRRPSSRLSFSALEGDSKPNVWRVPENSQLPTEDKGIADLVASSDQMQLSYQRLSNGTKQSIDKIAPIQDIPLRDGDSHSTFDSNSYEPPSLTGGNEIDDHEIEKQPFPIQPSYHPSMSQLFRDAITFNTYRERNALRFLLTRWSQKAKHQQQVETFFNQIAANRDAIVLARQAFDVWRNVFLQKRQEAQTERFFKHLGRRASRARDVYLMTKAFTHWAVVASSQAKKTSNAVKRMLCVRYFNAWRHLTVANELRIQRFVMGKRLNSWRNKTQYIQDAEELADELYEENLLRSTYWRWFWSFCDKRATPWHEYRLKQRALISWIRSLRTQREREQEIDSNNRFVALHSAFRAWFLKNREIEEAEICGDELCRTRLLYLCFNKLIVSGRLLPIEVHVSDHIDGRIARSIMYEWALRARMSREAKEVDRLRIMRNSFTTWNDRLRCYALSSRIDERLVMESLYKWIVIERFQLISRVRERRVKRGVLTRIMANSRKLYDTLLTREDAFCTRRTDALIRSKLALWKRRLDVQKEREYMAIEFYAPRLEQDSLIVWRDRHEHLVALDGWAKSANFYFTTMKMIKKWHGATRDHTKKRCQDLYAQFRRKVKMKLAARILLIWKSKARSIVDLDLQADAKFTSVLISKSSEIFDIWEQSTAARIQNMHDAETHHESHLTYSHLAHLLNAFSFRKEQDGAAEHLYRTHIKRVAGAQFRKLSLRIFQIKTHKETADALKERNLRKHCRNMFRYWVEKMQASLVPRSPVRTNGVTSQDVDPLPSSNLEQNELGMWTTSTPTLRVSDLVPPGSEAHSPAPSPGFLASPLARASRARTLAQASTTPATPSQTSFAARLFGQRSSSSAATPKVSNILSSRKSNGRSSLATVRFADDEESEVESPSIRRSTRGR